MINEEQSYFVWVILSLFNDNWPMIVLDAVRTRMFASHLGPQSIAPTRIQSVGESKHPLKLQRALSPR